MQSYPSNEIEGLIIFPDDVDKTSFYYLPKSLSLKRAEGGKPMFTFMRYQFPIERDGKEPGGGYLVFTTELRETEVQLDKVKTKLQEKIRATSATTLTSREVSLAPLDFTSGEVRMIIMQGNQFVRAVNLGRPSLFADNTASVAIELPADGATLFYEALKRGGSIGAIEYDLKFPIRLPAIQIIGSIDTNEVKNAMMTYTEKEVTNSVLWGLWSDRKTERHRTSISETLQTQGLVHLQIIKGKVDLSANDEEAVRSFAFRIMDEWMKNHFLKGASVETAEDRKSQWMEFLNQKVSENFYMDVSEREVIERFYPVSAQISPAFLGVPLDKMALDIDLGNAPWYFNNLEVTVDTNFDFKKYGDIVHSVVAHLSYDQPRPDGTRLTKRGSVVFTADDRARKEFKTRLAEVGKDTYHVDLEVNYISGPTLQSVLKRFDTTTRNLTLDVPNPGVIEISFTTALKAFDSQLTGIEIDVEYGDPRNNVPRAVETVVLNADKVETMYRRVIYAAMDKPFRYRFTYTLKDSDGNVQRSTTDWMEASSATRYVKVPTPFDESFSLTVIPSANWKKLRQLVIDLDYDDRANHYRVQQSFSFSKDAATAKSWKFPLRNPDRRSYQYAEKWLLQNGGVVEKDWVTRDKDTQSLVVGDARDGVVTVDVDPGDVGLGTAVRRVVVHLRYMDAQNNLRDSETLVFRKEEAQPKEWTFDRDAKQDKYAYDVEYVMSDGSRRTLSGQQRSIGGSREALFLPPPPAN